MAKEKSSKVSSANTKLSFGRSRKKKKTSIGNSKQSRAINKRAVRQRKGR